MKNYQPKEKWEESSYLTIQKAKKKGGEGGGTKKGVIC